MRQRVRACFLLQDGHSLGMDMWVLHGSDDEAVTARRAALLSQAGEAAEFLDLTEESSEGLFMALESMSLFSSRRVIAVDGVESLSEVELKRITNIESDAYVVMRAGTLNAAATKILSKVATIEKFATAKGRQIRTRVLEIAKAHNLTLTADVEKLLADRAGHDLNRVASVCAQLDLVGLNRPKLAQVQTLLGTCAPDGVPWSVTDALERRDISAAITASLELDGIATLAYLANQITLATAVHEIGARSPQQVADQLGATPFVAGKALWWSNALEHRCSDALAVLAEADAMAKSHVGGSDALVLAIGRLGALLRS
jgi:DNA polymerase III delta subunit